MARAECKTKLGTKMTCALASLMGTGKNDQTLKSKLNPLRESIIFNDIFGEYD